MNRQAEESKRAASNSRHSSTYHGKGEGLLQKRIIATADELDEAIGKLVRRFAFVGYKNIGHFAKRFCEHFGLSELPRDPFRLLPEVFGIQLERGALDKSTAAQWIRANGVYTIQTSLYRDVNQLALSLWHEFAEIMFAHPRFPSRLTTDKECQIATLFAVHVMMPEAEVRAVADEFRNTNISSKTGVIANRFGVSPTAARCRLGELGLLPDRNGEKRRWVKVPVNTKASD